MSLLTDAMEECVLMDKSTELDEYGGFVPIYKQSVYFKAAIVFDSSIQARRAEKEGVTSLYTVTTPRNIILEYRMVFMRLRDKKVFRVTSDGDDKATPKSTNLDMRQVTAEEWSLDSNG